MDDSPVGGSPPMAPGAPGARVLATCVGAVAVGMLAIVALWFRAPSAVGEAGRALLAVTFLALGAASPRAALLALLVLAPIANPLPLRVAVGGGFPLPLVALYAAVAGWGGRRVLAPRTSRLSTPFGAVLYSLLAAGLVSGVVTALRYVEFTPFAAGSFRELVVNTMRETNRHALDRVLGDTAVFAAGQLLLLMIVTETRVRAHVLQLVAALAVGLALSGGIGLYQVTVDASLGNTHHFVERGQINAGFIDPNALGACVFLALPMIVGLAVASRSRPARVALAVLGALLLLLLGRSGSRNGAAGVFGSFALGAALFLATSLRAGASLPRGWTRRRLAAAAVLVLAIGSVALFFAGGAGTTLGARLARSVSVVGERGVTGLFGAERWELWRRATVVIREYPVAGIGLGAYFTETPTFLGWSAEMPDYRDNAANYYLQTWAELGAIGLLLACALLAAAAVRAVRLAMRPDMLPAGVAASWHLLRCLQAATILTMIVLYITGPHTIHAEVQILFWTLLATTFARLDDDPATAAPPASTTMARPLWLLGVLLVLLLTALQLRSATIELNLLNRQIEHGLPHVEGFGPRESDGTGAEWHWIGRDAFVIMKRAHRRVRAEFVALHPDLAERPVTLSIFVDGLPAQTIRFDRPGEVVPVTIMLPPEGPSGATIGYKVDRTWVPADVDPSNLDRRRLGVMIHAPRVRYPIVVEVEPGEGGTVAFDASPARDGSYLRGTRLTATAHPADGFIFAEWTSPLRGGDPSISFTVTRPTRAVARFIARGSGDTALVHAVLGRIPPDASMDSNGDGRIDAADVVREVNARRDDDAPGGSPEE